MLFSAHSWLVEVGQRQENGLHVGRFFVYLAGVKGVQFVQIFLDAVFDALQFPGDLVLRQVVFLGVLGGYLGPVNGDGLLPEHPHAVQREVECLENVLEGFAVAERDLARRVLFLQGAECGNGVVRRRLSFGEPHHLDVSTALGFQPPGGTDTVEVAVEVDFEQDVRAELRSAA